MDGWMMNKHSMNELILDNKTFSHVWYRKYRIT